MCITTNVRKSSAILYKVINPSPVPHPMQCWKIKEIVAWRFQHCPWGGVKYLGGALLVVRECWFDVFLKALELYSCPSTFVHDIRCMLTNILHAVRTGMLNIKALVLTVLIVFGLSWKEGTRVCVWLAFWINVRQLKDRDCWRSGWNNLSWTKTK